MRTIYHMNQGWAFIKELAQAPTQFPADAGKIDLPHTWNAIDGQDGGNDYFRGTCCYVRQLSKAELPAAEQYFLEINGANSSADVYVNGQQLAHHDGGYSTWRVTLPEVE